MLAGMNRAAALLALVAVGLLTGCVSGSGVYQTNSNDVVRNYLGLARGYLQQGYAERAVKPINRALEIDPNSAEAYGMLGLVYQAQGEPELSEKAFRKALTIAPKSSEIRNNYGVFLFGQQRLDDAYDAFIRAASDVHYNRRSRAYENLGLVSLKRGQKNLAVEHFVKALKLNSSLQGVHLELATLYADQGEYRKAYEHYTAFAVRSDQNKETLALGVRLARINGDRETMTDLGRQLESLREPSLKKEWGREQNEY